MKAIVEKIKDCFQKQKEKDVVISLNINGNNPESIKRHASAGFERVSQFQEDMLVYFELLKKDQHRVVKVYYK